MSENRLIFIPAFLAAQALLVYWIAGAERPPAPPDLARFPSGIGEWKQFREDPIAADVAAQLRADRLLSRSYVRQPGGGIADLFVAWFQSQRAGAAQPHSPKVCLPGSGWIPEVTGEMSLPAATGAITVNRYVISQRGVRAVVLYWYQTPRRALAGEWEAKFWLVADALRDQRTDTALVRVVTWSTGIGDDRATAEAADLARCVYPLLRQTFPR